MSRANPIKAAFNAGEISPKLESRVDYNKYENGCATLCNMTPLVQGGIRRRPGSRFVAEVKDSAAKTRLLRFEFSTEQAYVIEAGNRYLRFFRNQGRIEITATDAAITNGDFSTDISGWTDRSGAGSSISHDATLNAMKLTSNGTTSAHAEQQASNTTAGEHVIKFRLIGIQGDVAKLRIGTTSTGTEIVNDVEFQTGYHAYAFTATAADFYVQFLNVRGKTIRIDDVSLIDDAPLELDTPYLTAELFSLKAAQSADIMYHAHPDHAVFKLARSGHTSWSLIEVDFTDGPWLDANDDSAKTLQPSAASGLGITITAAAASPFKSTDVGRPVRIRTGAGTPDWGYAVITAYTSPTQVTADVRRDFGGTAASSYWQLGSWSGSTGHPAAVGFFEQRFGAGRNTGQPQTFWMSQSADLENMRPDSYDSASGDVTVEDDDAMAYTFAAAEVNAIQWLSGGKQFVLGTSAGPWVAESTGAVLTPNDIQCRRQTTNGCADIAPARVDDVVLYAQRAKRKLHEFAYSLESDGYQSPDMTILADHITRSKLVEMAYQEEPGSVLWCVRGDGVLAAMTYRRGENVVGWARHVLGGTADGGAASVEGVTVIPGNVASFSDDLDEVWLTVKRTINGAEKRYVEFLERDFEGPLRHEHGDEESWRAAMVEVQKDAFYVDCGLTLDAPKTITGATQANPVVVTAAGHGFSNGNVVEIAGVKGMSELNGNAYTLAGVTAGTFELNDSEGDPIDATGFSAYISGGKARRKVTSVSGLDHLEGETVKILADGAVHPDKTVAGGAVALDYAAARVQAGLGYTHTFRSLKNAAGASAGTAVGKEKRIHEVGLVLLDAVATRIGPNESALHEVAFREVGDAMDTAVPLFTGEKPAPFDADWERDQRIVIQSDAPAPFTLLALTPEMKTNEMI